MKQTGTFHVYEIKNSQRVVSPIPNAFIYFVQNNSIKLTVKTDDKGKYSFDLPLGEYTVVSSSDGGIEQILANGSKFILTAQSTEKAFEEWVNAPSADVDTALLKRFKELAKQSQDATDEAQKILNQMNTGSIGSGKWLKEGAYGLGGDIGMTPISSIENFARESSGLKFAYFDTNPPEDNPEGPGNAAKIISFGHRNWYTALVFSAYSNRIFSVSRASYGGTQKKAVELYTTSNTTVDSNGFIKKASPIIKLFDDRIEANDQFYDEPIFEKIGTGTYKISNTKGLSKDGWTYEKPRGGDGTPYFRIEVTKLEDGCIISVHDEYDSIEEATITDIDGNTRKINKVVKVLSQARDIKPHERWIDLRFHEEPREEIETSEVVQ